MRGERFAKNCAFAVILFLLVNALQATKLPATEPVRQYIAFAFTTDWDYRQSLEHARTGLESLAGRLQRPASAPATPDPSLQAGEVPEEGGETVAQGPAAEAVPTPVSPPVAGDAGVDLALRSGLPGSPHLGPTPAPSSTPGPSASPATAPRSPAKPRLAWPVKGWISEEFGQRKHPISRLIGPHEGVDIGADAGLPVVAAAAGRVTAVFRGLTSGLTVELTHEGGLTTRYLHLAAVKVRMGDRVAAGATIGLVGSTGVSTGPHLHFEVRQAGTPVDPLAILPR